eukprot:64636-Chlamydomonas_euryale.AAC.4
MLRNTHNIFIDHAPPAGEGRLRDEVPQSLLTSSPPCRSGKREREGAGSQWRVVVEGGGGLVVSVCTNASPCLSTRCELFRPWQHQHLLVLFQTSSFFVRGSTCTCWSCSKPPHVRRPPRLPPEGAQSALGHGQRAWQLLKSGWLFSYTQSS